ncbi:MAG: hypothetical protein U0903_13620 [Planctomycetales bacterium]
MTNHHPRKFGTSKYGLGRVPRVILDLMTVKYLIQYLISPMKLFGGMGLACAAVSFLSGTATVAMKLFQGVDMTGNPLLMLTVFSGMLGMQFFVLGMLGELCARIYYQVVDHEPYAIRQTHNFDSSEEPVSVRWNRRAA